MPYRWTPPPGHATLEHDGKLYVPGDMVPISKHDAEHMVRYAGHAFEGLDLPEPAPATVIPVQNPPAKKID